MTDVFISYKHRLKGRVDLIAEALQRLGLEVWYDAGLLTGNDYAAEISAHLRAARCVIVCWSNDVFPHGGDKHGWVRGEAEKGRERDVLVAVMLEPTDLDAPWNTVQYADLSGWMPDSADRQAWRNLLRAIGRLIGRPGLAGFDEAEAAGTAEALTAWARAYADDPLASAAWEKITELEVAAAKAKVEAERARPKPEVARPMPRPTPTPTPPPKAAVLRTAEPEPKAEEKREAVTVAAAEANQKLGKLKRADFVRMLRYILYATIFPGLITIGLTLVPTGMDGGLAALGENLALVAVGTAIAAIGLPGLLRENGLITFRALGVYLVAAVVFTVVSSALFDGMPFDWFGGPAQPASLVLYAVSVVGAGGLYGLASWLGAMPMSGRLVRNIALISIGVAVLTGIVDALEVPLPFGNAHGYLWDSGVWQIAFGIGFTILLRIERRRQVWPNSALTGD